MAWLLAHGVEVLVALLAVSEGLALLPGLKANGILDGAIKGLKAVIGFFKKEQPSA